MKKLIILFGIILITGFVFSLNNPVTLKTPVYNTATYMDDDFLKNELNNAILDGFGQDSTLIDKLYFIK
jgi:hypothetical protein